MLNKKGQVKKITFPEVGPPEERSANWRYLGAYGTMHDMAKDWTKLYKKYKGMWVALDRDEETVLGFGVTVREAREKAKRKTTHTSFLTRVPQNLEAYVGAL